MNVYVLSMDRSTDQINNIYRRVETLPAFSRHVSVFRFHFGGGVQTLGNASKVILIEFMTVCLFYALFNLTSRRTITLCEL